MRTNPSHREQCRRVTSNTFHDQGREFRRSCFALVQRSLQSTERRASPHSTFRRGRARALVSHHR
jgi:hypothetical protein